MNSSKAVRNAYRKSENQVKIHPVKLIYMLYERVLVHLELAEKGILENNARLRGENLSKAIAIITELNASIKESDESEAAQFLRGLYAAILSELPKVSISNNVETLTLAKRYLVKLQTIWKETAMKEAGIETGVVPVEATGFKNVPFENKARSGYPMGNGACRQGLSVAI